MKRQLSTRRSVVFLIIAALAALPGCKEQLYSGLSEREANEMVAILRINGIAVDRVNVDDSGFSIRVDTENLPVAVAVLSAQGYPRERFDSIGDVFTADSLVSTPTEERARLIHALSQELSRSLTELDGVVSARVHVVLPESKRLARNREPARASVVIRHAAGRSLQAKVPLIKQIVENGIEGLSYENVTVALFPASDLLLPLADREEPGAASVEEEAEAGSGGWMKAGLPLVLAVLGVVLMLLLLARWRRSRKPARPKRPASGPSGYQAAGGGA